MSSRDDNVVELLQWALPKLGRTWSGYRKVRGQVGGRIRDRIAELGLGGLDDYRAYLEQHPDEWELLDDYCRITISRFYRGRGTWDALRDDVLPTLAEAALEDGRRILRAWSIGCASGEEPYTLRLCWDLDLAQSFPDLDLEIVATDAGEHMLERARSACYPPGCLRELPDGWRDRAFEVTDDAQDPYCLRDEFRHDIRFLRQDVRQKQPDGPFDIVFCRYVVFIYFDEDQQREILPEIASQMRPGAAFVIGPKEQLPENSVFDDWHASRKIFVRV